MRLNVRLVGEEGIDLDPWERVDIFGSMFSS